MPHQCGAKLIGRDWYVLGEWNLTETDSCKFCGAAGKGIFESRPGTWGAKRQRVNLRDFAA